mgnify:CR=1 FL=1
MHITTRNNDIKNEFIRKKIMIKSSLSQKTKLLLAEDDENLGLLLKEYLIAKGFDAELFETLENQIQRLQLVQLSDRKLILEKTLLYTGYLRYTSPLLPND